MGDVIKEHMPKKKSKKGGVSSWFSWRRTTPDSSNPATETSHVEADVQATKSVSSLYLGKREGIEPQAVNPIGLCTL